MLNAPPPRLGTDAVKDKLALLRLGWQIRKLGRRDMRELLRIGGMNVYDLLEEHFETPALKGALGLDATLGTNFGPRTPGTVLSLLYRMACEGGANQRLVQAQGGMGAVCEALAASARAGGAVIRTGATVAKILVQDDKACGVALSTGEEIKSGTVISSADPKTTFLALLGTQHLDTGFVRHVKHLRNRGLAAKLHLALDRIPGFTGVPAAQLASRLIIAPTLDHIERAYNHSKYGEFSSAPVFEITVPTAGDSSLAPAGKHVLSAIVQYAPYDVKGGWSGARERFAETAIQGIERYAPGLSSSIVAQELLTPADIEQAFRISGGHWHHAEFAFDQFLMVRPVPGAAQYGTPVAGLFLCGAGSHPGGGVTGIPGRNAARRVIAGVG
jgi:phytoene dehydrogenase-like protein